PTVRFLPRTGSAVVRGTDTMSAKKPEDVDRLFGQRVNAGDVEGIVALYEPGATLVTQDAGTLVGHDAIRGYVRMLPAMKPRIEMGVARVVPVGDDLAVVHHDWQCSMTGPTTRPCRFPA